MQTRIDWLSFTLEIEQEPITAGQGEALARDALSRSSSYLYSLFLSGNFLEYRTGRAPYKYGYCDTHNEILIYIGSNTGTVLFEVTGRGCSNFENLLSWQEIIQPIANRISRLDVATDMDTDQLPGDFVNQRSKGNSLSVGFNRSVTGETVYLGSMKSERYCRVYRYNEPHPRAPFLRFEAVYRRDYAKALAWAIIDATSWTEIANTVGERYGWQSEAWQPDNNEVLDVALPRASRNEQKTIDWLYRVCAPSIARLTSDGALDIDDFLTHVESLLAD